MTRENRSVGPSSRRMPILIQSARYQTKRDVSFRKRREGEGNRSRRQCSLVYAPVQGCGPASPEHPPSLSHGVSPVMRPLQPHGCWRTVNKADHFAACNFYLFLRTYVSLMAGPLITARNVGLPLQSASLTIERRRGAGHVDVNRKARRKL